MKKLVLIAFGLLVLLSPLSSLAASGPAPAESADVWAATNYNTWYWADRADIHYIDKNGNIITYALTSDETDATTNDTFDTADVFYLTSQSGYPGDNTSYCSNPNEGGGTENVSNVSGNGNSATLNYWTLDKTTGNCDAQTLAINNLQVNTDFWSNTFFTFKDSDTIETVNGRRIYSYTGSGVFDETPDIVTGSSLLDASCQDSITVPTSEIDPGTGRVINSSPNATLTMRVGVFPGSDSEPSNQPLNGTGTDNKQGSTGDVEDSYPEPPPAGPNTTRNATPTLDTKDSDSSWQCWQYPSFPIYIDNVQNGPTATSLAQTAPPPSSAAINQTNCTAEADTWLICGVIVDPLQDAMNGLAGFLSNILTTPTIGTSSPAYTIWQSFRDIADVLFVLAFMVMIFSSLLTPNVDAYTIKKVLPRLVAAAILVQLSYFLGQIALDIGNILGIGVAGIFSFIGGKGFTFDSGASQAVALGSVAGIVVAGVIALAAISAVTLIVALIAIIAVAFTLILRQVILILLVVVSPIAIVAWIFPGTSKFFKLWYTNLIKLVLMFPMIMALFGAGNLFVKVAGASLGSSTYTGVIQLIAYIAPLFFIPATFKASGSLMGFAAGKVSSYAGKGSKQLQDSQLAKNREENRKRRAALTATNPDASAFRRTIARKRGGFSGSTTGKLKLAAAGSKIRSDETDAAMKSIIEGSGGKPGIGLSDTTALAGIVATGSTAERTAALQMLGKTIGGRAKLSEMQTDGTAEKYQTEWTTAMRSNAEDIAKKAPHLFTPGTPDLAKTYHGMEAERVAGLDSVGMKSYLRTVSPTEAQATFGRMSGRQLGDVKSRFNAESMGAGPDGSAEDKQTYEALQNHLAVVEAQNAAGGKPAIIRTDEGLPAGDNQYLAEAGIEPPTPGTTINPTPPGEPPGGTPPTLPSP